MKRFGYKNYFTVFYMKLLQMAESKQISATVDTSVINDITKLADSEKRSFSNMVELLLMTGLNNWAKPRAKKQKVK